MLKCYKENGPLKEDDLKEVRGFKHKRPMKYSTIKEIVEILK